MSQTFATDDEAALPLHLVEQATFRDWLGQQPAPVAAWLTATGFEGRLGDLRLVPGADGAPLGAVLGLGDAAGRKRGRFAVARAVPHLPARVWKLEGLAPEMADEAALGWLFAGYSFDRYRPKKPLADKPRLVAPAGIDAARLETLAASETMVRDLINTPASDMGPEELELAFLAMAEPFRAQTRVIRGEELLSENFPMIHAVGRASPRSPRLLDLRWGERGPKLTLVGKGVCFDTGGLDLKPSSSMLLMKKDMGGAANVMGLARSIMTLGLPVQLRVLVPAVENAVGGSAFRPKDILTSRKGLTVEVNNTDAEGRLVLADALALADEEQPDLVISMATLTGAARVALGPDVPPFFTDDDGLAAALAAAGERVADPI